MSECIDHGRHGDKQRYASCWFQGRYVDQHVRALILRTGEQPNGRFALHSCDNKRCINPDHLRWGTQSDNMKDAVDRGRHVNNLRNHDQVKNRRRGPDNHMYRWTPEQVAEMRQLYQNGVSQVEIGRRFGIRQGNVSKLIRGKR